MATLYVTEYSGMAVVNQNAGLMLPSGNVAQTPQLVEQIVSISGSASSSSAFGKATTLVRLHCDAICSVSFGSAPSATTSSARMVVGQTEYFGVIPGHSVSVISNV